MIKFHDRRKTESSDSQTRCWRRAALAAAVLAGCFTMAGRLEAQVAPQASSGGMKLSAGGTGSGFYEQYGQQKLVGAGAFVDVDLAHGLGLEGEGRWLEWHQVNDVHVETYSAGVRYHVTLGRWLPYGKGLIGWGDFNFPFDYAHGSYLTWTAGGGVDYHLTRRFYIRAADVEYQNWPQFTYGAMTSVGVSAGVRVAIF
jgi:hypothetical protein